MLPNRDFMAAGLAPFPLNISHKETAVIGGERQKDVPGAVKRAKQSEAKHVPWYEMWMYPAHRG
jgi:hypothetical protein